MPTSTPDRARASSLPAPRRARRGPGLLAGLAGLLALVLAGLAGAARADGAPAAPGVKLYVLDCGVLLYNDLGRFGYKPGEMSPTNLSNGCYLVVHPSGRTLVWDTGAVPDALWGPDGFAPKKLYAEATAPLAKQLRDLGHPPESITDVAVSHAHWDHVANLAGFPRSTWITQPFTVERLTGRDTPDKTDPSMFEGLGAMRRVVVPAGARHDVFGDGSATLIPAPGHTPDSWALLVRLKETGPVLLAGDVWHFVKDETTNNTLPGEDRAQNLASRAMLLALARDEHAQVWVPHDFNQFAATRRAHQPYE